ncbi:MAG TPA: toll/interleukin-1 receptor domain-containing protein [Sorangium sp.]|nr:toll/interleukin-1 receptor domain-containing protein [Sorangium sp.]
MEPEHIFLSYAKEDAAAARRLHSKLTREGFLSWMDEHNLLPGQDWNAVVLSAIRRSRAFVLLLSRNTVSKAGYIQKEIREALEVAERLPEGRVFIIPLRIEDCDIPERLQRWQWIDINSKSGYLRLRESLVRHAGIRPTKDHALPLAQSVHFEDPAEHLLYQLVVQSGRLLHGRLPGGGYGISQGHFLAVRRKFSDPFRALKGRLSDIRKLPPLAIQSVLPAETQWKLPETTVRKVGTPLSLDMVVLASDRTTVCVALAYWRLALLLARMPVAHVTDDRNPVHIEDRGKLVMAIMPIRTDDDERKAIAEWQRS